MYVMGLKAEIRPSRAAVPTGQAAGLDLLPSAESPSRKYRSAPALDGHEGDVPIT